MVCARKKNIKRLILKQKRTRLVEDREDLNGLEMLSHFFFSKYTNDDVAPFKSVK